MKVPRLEVWRRRRSRSVATAALLLAATVFLSLLAHALEPNLDNVPPLRNPSGADVAPLYGNQWGIAALLDLLSTVTMALFFASALFALLASLKCRQR